MKNWALRHLKSWPDFLDHCCWSIAQHQTTQVEQTNLPTMDLKPAKMKLKCQCINNNRSIAVPFVETSHCQILAQKTSSIIKTQFQILNCSRIVLILEDKVTLSLAVLILFDQSIGLQGCFQLCQTVPILIWEQSITCDTRNNIEMREKSHISLTNKHHEQASAWAF